MSNVIILRGLPASGKSTWAREYVARNSGWKRVSKDDLRAMIDDGKWTPKNEKAITIAQNAIMDNLLLNGYNVVLDNTHLNPKTIARVISQIEFYNKTHCSSCKDKNSKDRSHITHEIKDFTDTPLEECIKRDQARKDKVGEKVIRQMYNDFLRPAIVQQPIVPGLPPIVLCDIDGTLALFGDANPYDRDFSKDELNTSVRSLLYVYNTEAQIIIFSGRADKYREVTEDWLSCKGVPFDKLYMRTTGDVRKDVIIKQELYNQHIKGKYNVLAVIDDRLQVCRMWYELGLPLFKVGDPDSDF